MNSLVGTDCGTHRNSTPPDNPVDLTFLPAPVLKPTPHKGGEVISIEQTPPSNKNDKELGTGVAHITASLSLLECSLSKTECSSSTLAKFASCWPSLDIALQASSWALKEHTISMRTEIYWGSNRLSQSYLVSLELEFLLALPPFSSTFHNCNDKCTFYTSCIFVACISSNPCLGLKCSGAVVVFQALVHHYCLYSCVGVVAVELSNNPNLVAMKNPALASACLVLMHLGLCAISTAHMFGLDNRETLIKDIFLVYRFAGVHHAWQRRFDGDDDIGMVIILNFKCHEICFGRERNIFRRFKKA